MSPHRLINARPDGMRRDFDAALAQRGIEADAAQQAAAERLQRFYDELVAFKAVRRSRLRKLLFHPRVPQGVWLHGGVGRGKSFLMDCFFAAVPYRRKRRVHFHAFMREVHQRLVALKEETDPLPLLAAAIADETRLLCFDEFHVADIADAMILGRLMSALFDAGVVFCITSNYPPDGLYPNGLHRERLLPAIALLKEKLDVIEIDAGVDYRLRALEQAPVYLLPQDGDVAAIMMQTFTAIAHGGGHSKPFNLAGRELAVVHRAPGVIWCDFNELCRRARSRNDYLELAHAFHTIFISAVPQLQASDGDAARRLTWLVDICYDHHVKLVIAAAVSPPQLYTAGPHANEFARTVSRLIEMRSHDYLASAHRRYETHAQEQ